MPRDPERSFCLISYMVWALAADGYNPFTPYMNTGIPKEQTFFSPRSTVDVTCTLEQYWLYTQQDDCTVEGLEFVLVPVKFFPVLVRYLQQYEHPDPSRHGTVFQVPIRYGAPRKL